MQTTNNSINKQDFRKYNLTDNFVDFVDTAVRTLFGKPLTTTRENPADKITPITPNTELESVNVPSSLSTHRALSAVSRDLSTTPGFRGQAVESRGLVGKYQQPLSLSEKKKSAGLMRVNHCGEVCAQALYQGQAITARNQVIKAKLKQAAVEENDHLAWCESRLKELDSHTSYLNPLWYIGSLTIGIIAGIAGDKWNLGFLAETENQVSKHLGSHLEKLPNHDYKSRAIVEQMKVDEEQHEYLAITSGAAHLPALVKYGMRLTSKVMTSTVYYF